MAALTARRPRHPGAPGRAAGFALLNLHGEYQASRELALSLALNNLADRR
ncbi:hypothetical protein I5F74_30820, partial [Pseudomonas aeruginosa]|nr:hypothetical protein [Pseudomonas aeruginosa]